MSYFASLQGRVVLVTGATSGFGLAMTEKFIASGAKVIATGRRQERLEALQTQYGREKLHILCFDVSKKAETQAALHALPPDFANIDIVVNNAGLALGFDKAPDTSLEDWEQMIDTNIKGVLYVTDALLPDMVKRASGHIVNIGSVAGNYPYPGGNVYGATKAFLKQFSLNLRADLLGKNIRVTNIEPGIAETEFSITRFHGDTGKAKAVYADTQALTAQDIAETVCFCVTAPSHVNVNSLEIMPTRQAFSPFAIDRKE